VSPQPDGGPACPLGQTRRPGYALGVKEKPVQTISDLRIFRQTLVVLLAAGFAVVVWQLTDILLLLAAGMLVAFIFWLFAHFLQTKLRVPFPVALTLAMILPITILSLVFWAFGAMLAHQFAILFEQLPDAFTFAENWLNTTSIGQEITARAAALMPDGGRVVDIVQAIIGGLGTIITSLIVVLIAGVYLAAQPRLYGSGILSLIPPGARAKTVSTVGAVMTAMSQWLKAQAVSMLFVGISTSIALSLIGIPAAPAIGLMAGICEFVPYLGVVVVAIPTIILGFSISLETGIWTIIALLVIQQVEGNIILPLVQSSITELPPALTIFSLITFGVLLGPMGVILAVPLTVVCLTLVKALVPYDKAAIQAMDTTTGPGQPGA